MTGRNALAVEPPEPPWEFFEMRRHLGACPLCQAQRACPTGVALTQQWLVIDQRLKADGLSPMLGDEAPEAGLGIDQPVAAERAVDLLSGGPGDAELPR